MTRKPGASPLGEFSQAIGLCEDGQARVGAGRAAEGVRVWAEARFARGCGNAVALIAGEASHEVGSRPGDGFWEPRLVVKRDAAGGSGSCVREGVREAAARGTAWACEW